MENQFQKGINTETLKFYREKLDLTQEGLAIKIPVDKGTYNRWETGNGDNIRITNQKKLAKALGVSVCKLRQPISGKEGAKKNLELTPKTRAALEVVADTYHVSPRDIIDFAPYLFHIMAGASLGSRKQKVDEAVSTIDDALKFTQENLPHMSIASSMAADSLRGEEGLGGAGGGEFIEEIEAINNQQLFDVELAHGNDKNNVKKNPFTNFLQPFVEKIPDQLSNVFEVEWIKNGLPVTCLTDSYLSELTLLPIGDELFEKVKVLINSGKLSRQYFLKHKPMEKFISEHMKDYIAMIMEKISKIEENDSNQ